MSSLLLIVASVVGLLIACIDSSPNWDDTAITALALFLSCGLWASVQPKRPWLWALLIGVWTPLLDICRAGNYGSILALGFAFAGAYAGMVFRKLILPA